MRETFFLLRPGRIVNTEVGEYGFLVRRKYRILPPTRGFPLADTEIGCKLLGNVLSTIPTKTLL